MNSKFPLALALTLSVLRAHAALFVNGSFEAATNAATLSYESLSPGSTNIPGWTTTNAELTWDGPDVGISPPLTAAQGSDFLDLTGLHDTPPYGAVFQTIATTPGVQYQISFEVGSDQYYDTVYTGTFSAPVVTVSLNGVVVFAATNNFPGLTNHWQTWSFAFTASATNTTLMFTGATSNRVAYIGLDNVIVTGPPPSLVTTIDRTNRNAYGANFGWTDWVADTNHGAVIGDYVCSGYIYSANVGWINLGNGNPTNGIRYQNLATNDFGVNQDGLGNLSGCAWSANIGWLNFENTGHPVVNLKTGIMSGYVWSANCGWISLSNAVAYVQTDTLYPGPLAPDGLPIPWLLTYFGTTNVNANADPTGKGMTIAQDYVAGTDPNNINSVLRITSENFTPGGLNASLTWLSEPTRLYFIEKNPALASTNWFDSGLGQISPGVGASTTSSFTDTNAPARFYRVQAVLPLSP